MWVRWTSVEAKTHLAQILKTVKPNGPQVVTFHGQPIAVIVDYDRYIRMCHLLEARTNPAGGPGPGPQGSG